MERRLNISQVAALYQISARTLRYYEEVGILASHRKTDSKYREYDREQCRRLEIILLLRRLSFSVKMIAELLRGDEANFLAMLQEKIENSGKKLLEARETDRLLRDLAAQLSCRPVVAFNVADILSEYTYLTSKTERMIPMNPIENEKYHIAVAMPLAAEICNENAGGLIGKIGALRAELEKQSVALPKIRIRDNVNLPENHVFIVWDGEEVWRKDFGATEAAVCADEIVEQLRQNCLK